MMELRKIDPAKNMRRFYRLSVEPTLFGDFALVREWGRIGAKAESSIEDKFKQCGKRVTRRIMLQL